MLKPYFMREPTAVGAPLMGCQKPDPVVVTPLIAVESSAYVGDEDYLKTRSSSYQRACLPNPERLKMLPSQLSHLSCAHHSVMTELTGRFVCLFEDVLTRTTILQHDIDVYDTKPIRQHPYRVNATKRQLMKKETDYLLEHGLAVPGSSAGSSPCPLETKPDGSLWFITDFRRV